MTNVPAASGFSTRNVYNTRSFSIEGGGGGAEGDIGAADREFPMAGAGGVLGVTDVGAPVNVPVPATVIVPGTSESGTQRPDKSKSPLSLSMCADCTFCSAVFALVESGPPYSNCSVTL